MSDRSTREEELIKWLAEQSTKRQALEYVERVELAMNGDTDAQAEVGDIDEVVECLCDYVEALCRIQEVI